ncbi:hypothetical protein SAMN05216548_1146 [Faunimonas pinastri]|uniref:Uncharacterized protein n=2 Tax=Faunimonas pinastri TaxID=1855383 RepID=A0A1H9MQE2_9HYPH|nr:hypothetical protein SAMN05216548_1146 [Faunimonas pinastri]
MTMRIDLLAELLSDAGLGVAGESLFLYEMPAECSQGLLIKTPLTGIAINEELPGYFKFGLQVIVRAMTHGAGEDLAGKVIQVLTINQRRIFTNQDGSFAMQVNRLMPETLPIVYPRADSDALEWSINFACSLVLPH